MRRALEEPTRQIANNAGDEGSVIVASCRHRRATTATTPHGEVEDLVKAGIIDPAKVTKTALLNASSIAGLMLTTEALVSEIKEKDEGGGCRRWHAGGGMGGGMGDMY